MSERSLLHHPPEYFEILLYLARVSDLKGKTSEAERIYKQIIHHSTLRDSNIQRLARSQKRYKKSQIKKLIMPYSTYIPFD